MHFASRGAWLSRRTVPRWSFLHRRQSALARCFSAQSIVHADSVGSSDTSSKSFIRIVDGPPTRFGAGHLATLTESSVVGTTGKTVVLSTVATEHGNENSPVSLETALKTFCNAETDMLQLTVQYQERHHAVGRVPGNARRRDGLRSTDEEILASRAIDRALRPLLVKGTSVEAIHVTCSVQAHDVWGESGNPVALSLNSSSVALSRAKLLKEPVACCYLCCLQDGTVIMDPTPKQVEDSLAELLYAGTRTEVVMMECSSPTDKIPEDTLAKLMKVAHSALGPIFGVQDELISAVEEEDDKDDRMLRQDLGLPPLDEHDEKGASVDTFQEDASRIVDEAYEYCHSRMGDNALRLFGYDGKDRQISDTNLGVVIVHPVDQPLLPKSTRGRREHLVFTEVERMLKDGFAPQDERLKAEYEALVQEESESISMLARAIHSRLLKAALLETASRYQTRGDERGGDGANGCHVIRPLSVTVPALPDSVHGSAIFARGDTQVLCTTTLGAPVDGVVKNNPFQETVDPRSAGTEAQSNIPRGPYDDLPVGSLRYLRSQEALLSDLNSRKVKAEAELTGQSGSLDEVRSRLLLCVSPFDLNYILSNFQVLGSPLLSSLRLPFFQHR